MDGMKESQHIEWKILAGRVAVVLGNSVSAVERANANRVKASRLKFVGPQKVGHWKVLT